jgi:hypothetical protein
VVVVVLEPVPEPGRVVDVGTVVVVVEDVVVGAGRVVAGTVETGIVVG